ncbi:Bro-N domain-containing protein [Pseudomonas sp. ZM23]|uniref:Bro-N domain-containing protein n=1 Tax=Pseudomonas triclosanedens TaxID=2961893 RepID=A0ABY7A808_9PSED|nr:Bro-N domain-containing protein [Pseudomonas triclosanedens]MCP8466360.1 Bro-N domain-containing protein [Pseudomonas triclosanedens]MCP8471886.1 Bro-N domain-containing protein [Pseudomonas triclosanedens]MCP8478581.1 Bro-N domain-containing protein [Pseudomonas triclosanedens]WAI52224.1 Bro-N domain-containing protein [Pseudomonas triclosanedens]
MDDIYIPIVFHRYNRSLRGVLIDNQPWLVARELGYLIRERVEPYVLRLDEDLFRESRLATGSGEETVLLVNDFGVFHVLQRYRDPEHRELRKWITSHVLPLLRDQAPGAAAGPRRMQARGEGHQVVVLDWQGELWVPMSEVPRLMSDERRGRWWRRK